MHASGIIERIAQCTTCAVSLALWAALDSDLNNALWWAAKLDAHEIAGSVRPEKVAICLGWSLLGIVVVRYRYHAQVRAVLALLVGVLIVQLLFGLLTANIFAIPGLYLIVTHLLAAIVYWLAPTLISAVLAYLLVTRRLFLRITESVVAAAILSFCATMLWVGLFDVIHPGIRWR
jgi:hypothetical protein